MSSLYLEFFSFFSSFFGKYHLHILLCFSPKCQHPLERSFYMSGYLVSVAAAKGPFLIIWLWRLKGLHFQSTAAVTIRERLLDRLPPLEHCMDSRLKQPPSPSPQPPHLPPQPHHLSERQIYLLVQELWLKGQASGLAHFKGPMELLPGCNLRAPPLPSSSSPIKYVCCCC